MTSGYRGGILTHLIILAQHLLSHTNEYIRKTGITLQENERDDYGLERIDGIFSSPVRQEPTLPPPPPPAPESEVTQSNGINQANGDRRGVSPQATAFAVKQGRGRPPKPRTPIVQNHRESESEGEEEQDDHQQQRRSETLRNDKDEMSPRKQPAHLWRSSEPSLLTTPGMNNMAPSMRKGSELNETGLFSGTPKRGPGRPRKNPLPGENHLSGGIVSQLQQQQQQQEPGLFMTPPKRGPGRPRKHPLPVEQQQPMAMPATTDSPQLQLDDEESMLDKQPGFSAPQAQQEQQQQPPIKRKRGRPRKSDTGNTPASSSVTLQHGTQQAPPMLSQSAREYTADVLNGAGINGATAPIDPVILQQAAAQAARAMQINANANGHTGGNASAAAAGLQPHTTEPTSTTAGVAADGQGGADGGPPQKRKRGRPKGSKNKPKNPAIKTNGDDRVEAWEDDPGVVNGPVKLWDPELESSLDYLVEDGECQVYRGRVFMSLLGCPFNILQFRDLTNLQSYVR